MAGPALPCKFCSGHQVHGGHDPDCWETKDSADCPSCGCAVRAHTRDGCYSHGCTEVVGEWVKRKEIGQPTDDGGTEDG